MAFPSGETGSAVSPVREAELDSETPLASDQKRISTTGRPDGQSHSSSLVPEVALGPGVDGRVGEPLKEPTSSAGAFEHHSAPIVTESSSYENEKHKQEVAGNGSSGTNEHIVKNEHDSGVEAEESDDGDVEVNYPGGLQLGLLTFGLCMATFTIALDNTIIATAIPKITSVFNSLEDVGWYGSSYLLTTTALQPSFGRIYTYFNVKWTYIFALVLFEFGSILCAAAVNSTMLIVGRAVAGAGASALFSGGMTIVGFTVPLERRPILSRHCRINLPFGAVAIAAVILFFKNPKRKSTNLTLKQKILEIDLLGALFLICSIVCLLLALQWGGSKYPWSDSKVWGCLLGFGLMITVFVGQQFRRKDRATIPPRIFGQKTVLYASLYSCFLSMGLYAHIYYLPFYFQAVKGTTAEGSGIRTIPYLGSIIASSIIVGSAITIIGVYKPFMIFGGAIFTVGAGLIYTLTITSPAGKWIGYQLLSGFGAGAGVQIPFIAVQVVLDAKDMPSGNAIAIFFNSLGGAISISIAQNVFSNGLSKNLPKYAPEISPQLVIQSGATYLREFIAAPSLPGVLRAYMEALTDSYVIAIAVGGIATICACFVEWKSVKGKKIVASAA